MLEAINDCKSKKQRTARFVLIEFKIFTIQSMTMLDKCMVLDWFELSLHYFTLHSPQEEKQSQNRANLSTNTDGHCASFFPFPAFAFYSVALTASLV